MSQVKENNYILAGYESYCSHQYAQALKYYTIAARESHLPLTKYTIQSAIAIIHIHMCNYQEAATILYQLSTNIKPVGIENALILIKVYCSLALISIINAQSSSAQNHIATCLNIINQFEAYSKIMFKVILQLLFGFDSFRDMQNVSNSLIGQEGIYVNAVMCSSMAMNRQLCGNNIELAYRLQNKAYEIFKMKKDNIMMTLSCRHLLHLSKQLNLSKNITDIYQKQLNNLIKNSNEISGISQSTLFRNYDEKIAIATQITKVLFYFQNQKLNQNDYSSVELSQFKKKALINKLKRLKNQGSENVDSINRTIQIVRENNDKIIEILQSLERSEFIREGIHEYKKSVQSIANITQSLMKPTLKLAFTFISSIETQKAHQNKNLKKISKKMEKVSYPKKIQHYRTETFSNQHNQQISIGKKYTKPIKIQQENRNYSPFRYQTSKISTPLNYYVPTKSQQTKLDPSNDSIVEYNIINQPNEYLNNKSKVPLKVIQKQERNQIVENSKVRKDDIQLNSRLVTLNISPRKDNLHQVQHIREKKKTQINAKIDEPRLKQIAQNKQTLIKKCLKKCNFGQYIMKKHYSSDGGQQKFLLLTKTHIKWASDENKIQTKYQEYSLKDIKGIVFGRVTDTFLKECNSHLQSWKCFSLILQKRTLDFYCPEEKDIQFWVPGIKKSISQYSKPISLTQFSVGKVLWRRALLKLNFYFVQNLKSYQRRYRNPNAYAIIQFGKVNMQINLSKFKKHK